MDPEKQPDAVPQAQVQPEALGRRAKAPEGHRPGEAYTAMPDFPRRGRWRALAAVALAAAFALGGLFLRHRQPAPGAPPSAAQAQLGR